MKRNLRYLVFVVMTVTACFSTLKAGEPSSGPVLREVVDNVIQPGGVFNVATYQASQSVRLAETGLREAGLVAGPAVPKSDEIRIFSSREVMNAAPLARIWLNAREGGQYWFITGGEGSAAEYVIPEGAVVVIWTKAGTAPVSWTNVFR